MIYVFCRQKVENVHMYRLAELLGMHIHHPHVSKHHAQGIP